MDTITKNTRKTLLATVVVAMLALVAVAGVVTYADDSAASSSTDYSFLSGDVTVDSTMASTNIFIYGDSGSVTIPADVSYTGTVSFGYYYSTTGVYVACDTVTLSDVSDMVITYNSASGLVVKSDSVDGVAVSLGTVQIGTSASTGTVTAGNATIAMNKTYGLTVTVSNNSAYLSGTIAAGTVTVSGTAYTNDLTVADGATMTVADGATVTTAVPTSSVYKLVIGYSGTLADTYNSATLVGNTTYEADNTSSTSSALTFTDVASGHYMLKVQYTDNTMAFDVAVNEYGSYYVTPLYSVSTTSGTATASTGTSVTYSVSITTNYANLKSNDVSVTGGSYASTNNISVVDGTNTSVITIKGLSASTDYSLKVKMGDNTTYYGLLKVTATSGSDGTFTLSQIGSVTSVSNGTASASSTTYDATFEFQGEDLSTAINRGAATVTLNGDSYDMSDVYVSGVNYITLYNVAAGTYSIVVTVDNVEYSGGTITVDSNTCTVSVSSATTATVSNSSSVGCTITMTDTSVNSIIIYNNGYVNEASDYTVVTSDLSSSTTYYVFAMSGKVAKYVGTLTYDSDDSAWKINNGASDVASGSFSGSLTSNVVVAGDLFVLGTMNVTYDSTLKAYNTIATAGKGEIYVAEYIDSSKNVTVYESAKLTVNQKTAEVLSNVNAVYYSTAATSAPYTYVYTSMTNALASSTSVNVAGDYYVLSDMTLASSVSGATTATVTVDSGAQLIIGASDSAAVVTVPSTTTLALTSNNTTTPVMVVLGQLKLANETSDRGTSYISADVFTTTSSYGIYSDLSTALTNAVSGDTLNLRQAATVTVSSEVKDGVTLNLGTYNVAVGDTSGKSKYTPTLTVDGTMSGTSGAVIIYTGAAVVANTSDAITDTYCYVINGGALTVGEDATLNYVDVHAIDGTFTVDGTYLATFDNLYFGVDISPLTLINNGCGIGCDWSSSYVGLKTTGVDLTLNVNGKMVLDTTDYFHVDSTDTLTLNVAGELDLSGIITNNGETVITVSADGKIVTSTDVVVFNNDAFSENATGYTYNKTAGTLAVTVAGFVGLADDAADGSYFVISNVADTAGSTIAVTGTGVFAANIYDESTTLAVTVSDSASFIPEEVDDISTVIPAITSALNDNGKIVSFVGTLTATDSATVGSVDGLIAVKTATVGTASTAMADATNDVTAHLFLGFDNYAIVYGTAADVSVSALGTSGTLSVAVGSNAALSLVSATSTQLYTVGTNTNYLYATEYAGNDSVNDSVKLVQPTLSVTGYTFLGWYTAAQGGNVLSSSDCIGDYTAVYALFSAQTYTVTFGYTEGAVYLVNGAQTASGQYTYAYGTELTVSVIAADGYSADGATVAVNGGTSAASQSLTVTADATVSAAGITENPAPSDSGLTLTDYLLVVLVVITAVVAIAVVMKLLRK